MRKVLITGAAGAVGRLLAPLLEPDFDLRLCDLHPSHDRMLQGDLADPEFARRMVTGVDAVVHLAGLVASQVSFEDTLNGNYRALLAVLEACRRSDVKRFIFASSHHILGMLPSNYTYNESAAPVPDSFYGLSKAFGEAACAMYAYRFGISTLVLRIGNADPQIVDGRRERLWISARDLAQLVKLGLTAPALQYEIANAVSNCPDPLLSSDTAAAKLGYQPQGYAVDHHAPAFRSLRDLAKQDGPGLVGGRFAADPLPDPFTRLTK